MSAPLPQPPQSIIDELSALQRLALAGELGEVDAAQACAELAQRLHGVALRVHRVSTEIRQIVLTEARRTRPYGVRS